MISACPNGGLNIRLADTPRAEEERLQEYKRDAVLAFLRAQKLNRFITSGGARPRIGIATVGKSYLDVRLALDELGIDEVRANDLGIRPGRWPAPGRWRRRRSMSSRAGSISSWWWREKRSLIEVQVREELYGTANQPVCIGKKDEEGRWLFPVKGALDPNDIATSSAGACCAMATFPTSPPASRNWKRPSGCWQRPPTSPPASLFLLRLSTQHLHQGCRKGMRGSAGIGCHYMVQWMDRATVGFTQNGREGANWIGEAPFSKRGHLFQNLGDGTYNHSGYLALRAAVAAKVNITYKILFNDAVAMTGGQRHEGDLTVPVIARQVAAEGVARVVLVTDEPDKYAAGINWPAGLTIHHRDELDHIQRELAAVPRRHRPHLRPDLRLRETPPPQSAALFRNPDKRVIINERVCEGCGDCGVKSNCVSVQPLETEWGRKGDRPVVLQQGLLLRERLLPLLRHRAWGQTPQGGGRRRQDERPCPLRARPSGD